MWNDTKDMKERNTDKQNCNQVNFKNVGLTFKVVI